jgi:Ca2+-binding RTX toxin-like protein
VATTSSRAAGGDDGLAGDASPAADGGRDLLTGGDGDDFLYTENGADALSGGPGNDRLFDYDNDDDVLHGDDGDDNVASGLGGRDQLFGDAGNDTLDDYLVPGTGQVLDGGTGVNMAALRTRFVRDQTEQRPAGTTDLRDGTTTVEWPEPTSATVRNFGELAVPARWTVWGTDGAETIKGAYDGPLTVHARGGDDRLIGTVYADALDGGDGIDAARPGKGNDTCVSIERTNLARETCNETAAVGPAQLVSVGSGGGRHLAGSRGTLAPSVSADGRYVAFNSLAALVPRTPTASRTSTCAISRPGAPSVCRSPPREPN